MHTDNDTTETIHVPSQTKEWKEGYLWGLKSSTTQLVDLSDQLMNKAKVQEEPLVFETMMNVAKALLDFAEHTMASVEVFRKTHNLKED